MSGENFEGPPPPERPKTSEALFAQVDEMLDGATTGSPALLAISDTLRKEDLSAEYSRANRENTVYNPILAAEYGALLQKQQERRDEVHGYVSAEEEFREIHGLLLLVLTREVPDEDPSQLVRERLHPKLDIVRKRPLPPHPNLNK